MNLIIPMAGRGSRLRPHTLTIPKPLVPVAGKPIVHRLAEDLTIAYKKPFDNISFVIGDFGEAVEKQLLDIAASLGAQGHIHYQNEPLGTAHAIACAEEFLEGPAIIAFGDTLFSAAMDFDENKDGIIWAKRVEDPSAYGVLELNADGIIENFVEKPEEFVSDLAITGIYFVSKAEKLRDEIRYLLDNDIKEKGEYQLTNALENMKQNGNNFYPGIIDEWLDLGNKSKFVYSNQRVLELKKSDEKLTSDTVNLENSVIIPPCYIGDKVKLKNCIIGPHVSIGKNSIVSNSIIKNSVVQNDSSISDAIISDSMIGNYVKYTGKTKNLSIGDYTEYGD